MHAGLVTFPMILVAALTFRAPKARAERVIHVDSRANGVQDETSWQTAFADLQDALDDTREYGGCPCEIWIAKGTYRPDRGTGDQTTAFNVSNGVSILGGFEGWESCIDERDWVLHETILSGDLNGDDKEWESFIPDPCCEPFYECDNSLCMEKVIAVDEVSGRAWYRNCSQFTHTLCCDICRPESRCDNSKDVVRLSEIPDGATIDGFTVSGGEARDFVSLGAWGAGVYGYDAPATFRNCTFQNNAGMMGAAVHSDYGPMVFEDCLFVENEQIADGGPVLSNYVSEFTLTRCDFFPKQRRRSLVLGRGAN